MMIIDFQQLMLRSSPPGKFVHARWEVVFTTAGALKSLLPEKDGGVLSHN